MPTCNPIVVLRWEVLIVYSNFSIQVEAQLIALKQYFISVNLAYYWMLYFISSGHHISNSHNENIWLIQLCREELGNIRFDFINLRLIYLYSNTIFVSLWCDCKTLFFVYSCVCPHSVILSSDFHLINLQYRRCDAGIKVKYLFCAFSLIISLRYDSTEYFVQNVWWKIKVTHFSLRILYRIFNSL